jgi:hypothetical protein
MRLKYVCCAGSLVLASCGYTRFAWMPGMMRGVHWACATDSTAGGDIARRLRDWTVAYTDPKSSDGDRGRRAFGLPLVRADSVRIVSDAAICRRAGLAYAERERLRPGTYVTAVVVAGNRYVVRSVTAPIPAGEWFMIIITDADLQGVGAVLGF